MNTDKEMINIGRWSALLAIFIMVGLPVAMAIVFIDLYFKAGM